ncbi:UNVERIFIED_CONTAM: hypothetical protein GTU68_060154 [Idotea baltica]|nr:hypothetical protein [Idotea baltica]
MKSAMPKVLHRLAGKPLLGHVLDTVSSLGPASMTVVIGHGSDQVKETITHSVNWAMQTEQLGTGHAVQQALDGIEDKDTVLITYGDVPLTRSATFQALLDVTNENQLGLLSLIVDDPHGYGRIKRVDGAVTGVVEQKDASDEELAINEINAGVLAVNGGALKAHLSAIDNNNAQGEYYLTDIFELAVKAGQTIQTVHPDDEWEAEGINSREQLAELERVYQQTRAAELMAAGVTVRDPARLDVRGTLTTGTDNEIDVNCVFIGDCSLGNNVSIGPNCVITDSHIGDGTVLLANSRLRPGSKLATGAKIGNFVETKNADIGEGSKVNHLSYVGDSEVGSNVNVGAGTITANYDGANKHKTVIADGASIGSNSVLVAPVTVNKDATVGAGSTISKDVPADILTFTRAKRTDITGWTRPVKKNK